MNHTSNFQAAGWSFGLFGRLTPELIWHICKPGDNSEHPDIISLLYVFRVSTYCNGQSCQEGARLYLGMGDFEEVLEEEFAMLPVWEVWEVFEF
jgi:hypothetical protein